MAAVGSAEQPTVKDPEEGEPSLAHAEAVQIAEGQPYTPPRPYVEALPTRLTSAVRLNMVANTASLALLGFVNWATWASFILVVVSGATVLTGCFREQTTRYAPKQQLKVLMVMCSLAACMSAAGAALWFLGTIYLGIGNAICVFTSLLVVALAKRHECLMATMGSVPPAAPAVVMVESPLAHSNGLQQPPLAFSFYSGGSFSGNPLQQQQQQQQQRTAGGVVLPLPQQHAQPCHSSDAARVVQPLAPLPPLAPLQRGSQRQQQQRQQQNSSEVPS